MSVPHFVRAMLCPDSRCKYFNLLSIHEYFSQLYLLHFRRSWFRLSSFVGLNLKQPCIQTIQNIVNKYVLTGNSIKHQLINIKWFIYWLLLKLLCKDQYNIFDKISSPLLLHWAAAWWGILSKSRQAVSKLETQCIKF